MADNEIKPSEVTPESVYLNRRNFMKAAVLAGTGAATVGLYKYLSPASTAPASSNVDGAAKPSEPAPLAASKSALSTDEEANTFEEITNYNNYYEFSTSKSSVADKAKDFVTRPWTIEVGGLANKPQTFDIDALLKWDQEERIYRHRCVEGWSMVIPWIGFPLKKILDAVEPNSKAKYVAFETYFDKKQMPNWRYAGIDLPYVEGLRLDEAMHPLTILATGLYGKTVPNQNGAPIRLVVPWKYGFKSIKSVVKITLTDRQPPTTWNLAIPSEYGFYSNVNPEVDHPRWSQATENRIGEFTRRKTEMFNGYAEQVAGMYAGMDLVKNF